MADFFAGTRPGRTVTCGGATFELPILYHRDDAFALFFTADYAKVKAVMPSDRLFPVAMPGGKALVGFAAFNYIETSIGPYGEVGVVAAVVHGAKPLPVLPGLLETRWPNFGLLVLHLPVTKTAARDAGRGVWGYTKFVADMRFRNTPEFFECRMNEETRHILTVRVAKRGFSRADRSPLVTYSVKDGRLIKTTIANRGVVRNCYMTAGSALELGDHEVARGIADLGLSKRPLFARYYLDRSGVLPAGEVVEENVRALEGYYGRDRQGELNVVNL